MKKLQKKVPSDDESGGIYAKKLKVKIFYDNRMKFK